MTALPHMVDINEVAPPLGHPIPVEKKFPFESFDAITVAPDEEWLVKRLLPARGVAALYGQPGSFKSFIASDLSWHVALGWEWAGRRVQQGPVVYIAAEGAQGIRKRKVGFEIVHGPLPTGVPFYLTATAPNLGTDDADLIALIQAIETHGIHPRLIVLDTLAQTLGAGDENGAGMTRFVANAQALANRFACLVLAVHHSGKNSEQGLRGHSSLNGAVDATLLCERQEAVLEARLTLQKSKDEVSNIRLVARLSKTVVGHDADGDEVTTLVVESIAAAEPVTRVTVRTVPRGERLLMEVLADAIDSAGQSIQSFSNGPLVRAVSDEHVRARYYARIGEKAATGDDADKIAERQRRAFNRAIKKALDAKSVVARDHSGERFLWLP